MAEETGSLAVFGATVWAIAFAAPFGGAVLFGWGARACLARGRRWGGGVLTVGALLLLAVAVLVAAAPLWAAGL